MTDVRLIERFMVDRYMGSRAFLLPLEARGALRDLWTVGWRRGTVLPNDEGLLQRLILARPEEWARVWPVIRPWFRAAGDHLVNDNQVRIFHEVDVATHRASTHGLEGARRRWRGR